MESPAPNPYAAPDSAPELPPIPGRPRTAGPFGLYRDNRRLAMWVTAFLGVGMLIQFAQFGLNAAIILTPLGNDASFINLAQRVPQVLSMPQFIGMVIFAVWIVRSAKNAWLFAYASDLKSHGEFRVRGRRPDDRPGWAVGWYFIPIASLWKPYQAMRDLAAASSSVSKNGLPSHLLATWWTLWILSMLKDVVFGPFAAAEAEWSAIARMAYWTSYAAVDFALHFIAFVLVRSVTRLQVEAAAEMAEIEGTPGWTPTAPVPVTQLWPTVTQVPQADY